MTRIISTIEQARDAVCAIELELYQKLQEFERQSGLEVKRVELKHLSDAVGRTQVAGATIRVQIYSLKSEPAGEGSPA